DRVACQGLRLPQDPQDRGDQCGDRPVEGVRTRRHHHRDQSRGRGAPARRRWLPPAELRLAAPSPQGLQPHGRQGRARGRGRGRVARLLHLRHRAEPVGRGGLPLLLEVQGPPGAPRLRAVRLRGVDRAARQQPPDVPHRRADRPRPGAAVRAPRRGAAGGLGEARPARQPGPPAREGPSPPRRPLPRALQLRVAGPGGGGLRRQHRDLRLRVL
ncbi:MAG: hypothetical protein AVDCRST_MAG32-2055, partial [uncultured Nocardioides sp.]